MRKILATAIFALLGSSAVCAQTVKTTPASVTAGNPDPATSKEMNIQAYIQLLRTDIRKSKSRVMGEVMQLDTDEAARFWPVYNEFEIGYSALGDQITTLVRNYVDNYDKMTDQLADQLVNRILTIEQQRNELKRKYYQHMKNALGAITAARFLQVENQLERLVDLQIAAQLPVVRRK